MTRARHFADPHQHRASIRRLQVCIGMAAHAIGIGHTLGIKNISDLVRLVAIDAGRQSIGLFLPKLAANDLAVYQFDIGVALGAGGSDIAPVDGRVGIGVWQDRVRRVTRGAVGRHNQPLLQQAFAVDALGIVFQDVVLGDVAVHLDRRALAVTLPADEGDFHRRH